METWQLYTNGRPIRPYRAQEDKISSDRLATESIKTAFSDLSKPIKAELCSTVESFFCDQRYATAFHDALITVKVTARHPAFDKLKADGEISEELSGLL